MKTRISRIYWIIEINCDCASYITARIKNSFHMGPRCNGCKKQLGPMQFRVLGEISAKGDLNALKEWKNKK